MQDFFHPQYHKQQNIASYMEFIKWNITNITNITSKRWTISENRCFMVFVMDSFRNQIPSQIILLADTMFPPKVLAIFLWIWVGNVITVTYIILVMFMWLSILGKLGHLGNKDIWRCSWGVRIKEGSSLSHCRVQHGIQQTSFFLFPAWILANPIFIPLFIGV